ncbi:MAG: DNA polymerase III subunit alpha [Bdellovibrionota bacterium]
MIALTGNRFGIVGKYVQDDRPDVALSKLQQLVSVMGQDNVYLEMLDTGLPIQKKINQTIAELASKLSLPYIAANDCHYLYQEDERAHDVILCVGGGKFIHEENRVKFPTDQYYFRSTQEMQALFADYPDAITNTLAVAERCHVELNREGYFMPVYETSGQNSLEQELQALSQKGMLARLDQKCKLENIDAQGRIELEKQYQARLDEELEIINGMGFAGYFLIVQDFINFAKNNQVPVGPGRGSAAGSLVAYSLKITDIDPIPYNLLFERFLNPERISMPDIDVDFCQEGRDRVLAYVSKKYDETGIGGSRVAQICTFGKMQARAAIRDVGRVLGIPYGEVDKISKMVPNVLNITLEEAFEKEPKFDEIRQKDQEIDELLTLAKRIEGLPRHASVHAAGVVISDHETLWNHVPLMTGQNNEIVTQWDMKAVEKIGLVKFDFLGLKTLTLLQRALTFIQKSQAVEIDLLSIPMDDQKVFDLLSAGQTQGIFQLESSGMSDLIMRLKPNHFEDIIALVALYRPGPLGSGMVDDFINRKHGRTAIVYDLPELESILKETYGVILYQEQVMQIASKLAHYTLGDADLLRRAMGKKIKEEMDQQEQKFLAGAAKNKHPEAKAKKIFDLMAKFAGYGFNKSHSAAYALISYQTAYLKTHYPVEFMAACFSLDSNNTDRVVSHLNDCRASNIEVLPPNVNDSNLDFSVVDGKIRFGLAGIKNVGHNAIESIISARDAGGPYTNIFELCERVTLRQVNKKVLESLIKSGALDDLGKIRAQMMLDLESAIEFGAKAQKDKNIGQDNLFGATLPMPESKNQDVAEWDEATKLQFEKDSVGFYISGHPLLKYEEFLQLYTNTTTATLHEKKNQSVVRLGGAIASCKEITTKKGKRMAFINFEDLHGNTEMVLFPQTFEKTHHLLSEEKPVFVVGKVDIQEDQAKILVDEMCFLDEAPSLFDGHVHIEVDALEVKQEQLQELKNILPSIKGSCPVYLHMDIPGQFKTVLPLDDAYRINPSLDSFHKIREQIGPRTKIFLK